MSAERLPRLRPEHMSDRQRAVYDAIAGGPRAQGPRDFPLTNDDGSLVGPFNVLAIAEDLGVAVQSIGEAIRYHGVLSAECRELAILLVARHWRADFEWYAHERVARRIGLPDELLESLLAGQDPELTDPAMAAVAAFTDELLETREVSDATYAQARSVLDDRALIELTALVGYYTLLAGVLNAFRIGLPEPVPSPFERD